MATTELTAWRVAAETKEWVGPITVTADGVPTTAFEVTFTAPGARPTNWVSPTALDGGYGVLIGTGTPFPMVPGNKYAVWIRFTDVPEVPVQQVGTVKAY